MSTAIPRLRGRVGEIDDPEGPDHGKFTCEVSMWTFDGEKLVGPPWTFGPFETRKLAQEKMMEVIRLCSETVEREITGKVSGRYLDMKNGGVMRSWDNQ